MRRIGANSTRATSDARTDLTLDTIADAILDTCTDHVVKQWWRWMWKLQHVCSNTWQRSERARRALCALRKRWTIVVAL